MMNDLNRNESGIAHLALIVLAVAVIGVGGLAFWRVSNANKPKNRATDVSTQDQLQTLPQNLENVKTLDEIGQAVGATNGTSIIKFVLESKDGKYVYVIVLSDGRKLVVDAMTGSVLSEEKTDISEDDKLPSGVQITVSAAQAYALAARQSSSPIKTIEMEVEDKKVVYKIEYKDGSKIEIDASTGAIIKSEIKNESEDDKDEKEEEEHEDEDKEDEDHEDEDRDEENHEDDR